MKPANNEVCLTMHTTQTYTIIRDCFKDLNIDLALIGAQSSKDLDLFVVNRKSSSLSNLHDTLSFLDRLRILSDKINYEIIVKHEHRSWVNTNKVLHLLFYPSYDHLEAWEVPSFIACTYSKGKYLIGNNEGLQPIYARYRNREPFKTFKLEKYHLLVYMDLAITNLIYLTIESHIFTKSVYFENLQYVFRYSLRELFVSTLAKDEQITFWEKCDLINYIENYYPQFNAIAEILKENVNATHIQNISTDQIKSLFIKYLELCDSCLSGVFDIQAQIIFYSN